MDAAAPETAGRSVSFHQWRAAREAHGMSENRRHILNQAAVVIVIALFFASCKRVETSEAGGWDEARSIVDRRVNDLIEGGRFADALALVDSLVASGAGDSRALGQKARALAGLGSSAEAIAAYEEAILGDYEGCENHLSFATYLMRIGKTGRAQTEFTEAKRFCEERYLPIICRNLAVAWIKLDRRADARASVDEGLRENPDDPYLLGLKGMLTAREAPAAAESLFARSRELGDASPEFLVQYGRLLLNEGRPHEAVAILEDASRRRPDDGEIGLLLADALDRTGRFREAEDVLRRLLDRGTDAGIPREKIEERLARALFHEADYEGALGIYRSLEETPEVMDRIAMSLHGLGRYDDALPWARKAAAAKPEWAQALINLAVILAAKGELAEAASLLERALRLEPDNAAARINLERLRGAGGDGKAESP